MEFKNFLQSSKAKHILAGIGLTVIALLIFQAGVFVGFKKATFSGRLGDNYYKTFGEQGGPGRMMPNFGEKGLSPSNAHGTIGKIADINLPQIIVADKDGVEKTVLINQETDIRSFRDSIKAEALKIGDFVVIIGEPTNEGIIDAKLIRIMPAPPDSMTQTNKATSSKTNNI